MWPSEAPCSSISKNQMKSLKPGYHIVKILLFRTHHLWNSTTELILMYSLNVFQNKFLTNDFAFFFIHFVSALTFSNISHKVFFLGWHMSFLSVAGLSSIFGWCQQCKLLAKNVEHQKSNWMLFTARKVQKETDTRISF